MENLYGETVKKLEKLRRNEDQMTDAQKIQYKEQLRQFKICIFTSAIKILESFLYMGTRCRMDDLEVKDMMDAIKRINKEEQKAGELKRLQKVLFTTYSLDKFLGESVRWHNRIWYEAYAPYWLTHVTKHDNPEYPYYNDLIDMYWWDKCNEWAATKIEDGKQVTDYHKGVTIMLPPTKELIEKEYAEERKTA